MKKKDRVKKSLVIWCVVVLMLPVAMSLNAAEKFEGEVDFHVSSKLGLPSEMKYFLKGPAVRVEVKAKDQQSILLFNSNTQKTMILTPATKTKMEVTLKNGLPGPTGEKMKKTGKTDTVLGKKCEEWLYEDENGKVSLWSSGETADLSILSQLPPDGLGAPANAVMQMGYFPLKITSWDPLGHERQTTVVTKIETKSLDPSLFMVPADYTGNSIEDVLKKLKKQKPPKKN